MGKVIGGPFHLPELGCRFYWRPAPTDNEDIDRFELLRKELDSGVADEEDVQSWRTDNVPEEKPFSSKTSDKIPQSNTSTEAKKHSSTTT
ncbi:hypothetical protein GNI_074430, partial [Gregarina niphandrodes]